RSRAARSPRGARRRSRSTPSFPTGVGWPRQRAGSPPSNAGRRLSAPCSPPSHAPVPVAARSRRRPEQAAPRKLARERGPHPREQFEPAALARQRLRNRVGESGVDVQLDARLDEILVELLDEPPVPVSPGRDQI